MHHTCQQHHGCQCKDCCPGHHHSECKEGKDCAEEFFMLAKEAWKTLMVEKIKLEMDKTKGEQLNQLAKLIAETKMRKWRIMMEKEHIKEEFKEQLKQLMGSCGK
jgi:hypothetical protein